MTEKQIQLQIKKTLGIIKLKLRGAVKNTSLQLWQGKGLQMEAIGSILAAENGIGSVDLTGRSRPIRFCTEAEVATFERAEREEWVRSRLKNANIPAAYAYTDIGNCCPEIREYASKLDAGETRGLVLRGSVGVGKTYAGCAILNHAANSCTVRFATMGDIIAEIRRTYGNSESELDVVCRYKNVRLLVLDDLGKEKPTPYVLEKVFTIIDGRYRAGKPTIVTTQYSARQLAERLGSEGDLDSAEAIVSRLQESYALHLGGGDRRSQMRPAL